MRREFKLLGFDGEGVGVMEDEGVSWIDQAGRWWVQCLCIEKVVVPGQMWAVVEAGIGHGYW